MICRTCNKDKSNIEFWPSSTKGKLQTECKSCMRLRNTEYCKKKRLLTGTTSTEKVRDFRRKNPLRSLINAANSRAKKSGLPYGLKLEDIGEPPEKCPVLGIPLLKSGIGAMSRSGERFDGSPSLDRIVAGNGYVKGNVIWVSWRANRLKNDASWQELAAISEFYKSIGENYA